MLSRHPLPLLSIFGKDYGSLNKYFFLEVSCVNGSTKNTFKEDDMLTRSNESQLGSSSQLCNEVEKDSQGITNSPRLLSLHDEDTGLTQLRPRVRTERNLFTELKLRKRRHCNVDSTTEDNSNSKKYASEMSDVINNNNNQETGQKQQQQQKESGFKEGTLLEKLNAEIDRLSAIFCVPKMSATESNRFTSNPIHLYKAAA